MTFLLILTTFLIIFCFSGGTTDEESITGLVGDMVTIPCRYSGRKEAVQVCWRKSDCSKLPCSSAILRTNGGSVIKKTSERYKLLGNITMGDASLTITKLTPQDDGTYCCKVIIPGPSNNVTREVYVQIKEPSVVFGSVEDTVTLPCTYPISEGMSSFCWGRDNCSSCADAIFSTNKKRVTKQISNRYELLGNITQGNASLTITKLTIEDGGIYCCNVYIPGPYNDVYKKITLQISGRRSNWKTPGNVIRGITIFLVPTMVLLIYKFCPL